MRLRLIEAASEWPVSLEEAKAQLRVDSDNHDDDLVIEGKIVGLADWLATPPHGWLNRSICEQTIEAALPYWPCEPLCLPYGPVSAIVSVTYFDAANASQTVLSSNYFLEDDDLVLVAGFSRPALYQRPGAVLIRYRAGDSDPAALPAGLRDAFLAALTPLYEHRGEMVPTTLQADQTAIQQLSTYRRWTV